MKHRGLSKFPDRDEAKFHCRSLVRDGKPLVTTVPNLGPPPQEMTREQRWIDRRLSGEYRMPGER